MSDIKFYRVEVTQKAFVVVVGKSENDARGFAQHLPPDAWLKDSETFTVTLEETMEIDE